VIARNSTLGGDDPDVIVNAPTVLAYYREDIGAMIALVDRALTVTPELRAWLVPQRHHTELGRSGGGRYRACRKINSPQPAHPDRVGTRRDRSRAIPR
jgi:hypothetical protein